MLGEQTKLSVAFLHTHTETHIAGPVYMACYPALI